LVEPAQRGWRHRPGLLVARGQEVLRRQRFFHLRHRIVVKGSVFVDHGRSRLLVHGLRGGGSGGFVLHGLGCHQGDAVQDCG